MPLRIFRSRNVSGRQRRPGADRRRDVRDVLPRRALPAAGARLRRARDRARLPAGRRSSWGRSSVRFSEPLIMRFGAARRCSSRASALIAAGPAPVRARPGRRQLRRPTCCPSMVLLGIGVGLCFPSLMTLAMSGATRATPGSPRAWSTPPPRSAARSAWPCWRPSSTTRTDNLLATRGTRRPRR